MENKTIPPTHNLSSQLSKHIPSMDSKDVKENKLLAVIAYLGILCLVPLLLKKDSPFAQFHGKQGLILLIAWVAVNTIMIVPVFGWIAGAIGNLFCLFLTIVGIVNALSGDKKELPWIGHYGQSLNL